MRRALDDHAAGGATRDQRDGDLLPADEARRFVLRLLANGRVWGTREIEAMVRADGHRLPEEPVRFLAGLRRDGAIAGEMDLGAHTWRWWSGGDRPA